MSIRQEVVYSVWMEWDYNQDGQVFASESLAWKWIRQTGVEEDTEETLEHLEAVGLVRVDCIPLRYKV